MMTEPMVTLRATATVYGYADDNDAESYDEIESGWVDPDNPYGSLLFDECDDTSSVAWPFLTLELPLREAARYAANFPGGVWDLCEDADGSQNYRTGETRFAYLHVSASDPAVESACLGLAWATMRRADARLAARYGA